MKQHQLFLYALDPTHMATGSYRLGHKVDDTVVRDTSTGLPIIPGRSIQVATRAAAAHSLNDLEERNKAMAYARRHILKNSKKIGVSKPGEDPLAKYFGQTQAYRKGLAQLGIIYFRDAEILAFPVPTWFGSRWITTASLLRKAGCDNVPESPEMTHTWVQSQSSGGEEVYPKINLGWLLLTAKETDIPWPNELMAELKTDLVIVHEDLFATIVNSHLETRTSIAFDFETGATVGGEESLLTYEATPRGTVYIGQVDFDNERYPELYPPAFDLVNRSLKFAGQLGLGAMTQNGFGRMLPTLVEKTHD